MKKLIRLVILSLFFVFDTNFTVADSVRSSRKPSPYFLKIVKAKEIILNTVHFPDTVVFYNYYTKIDGDIVTLKFACNNVFGIRETHTKDIRVD